jgi:anaerobic selenocysteine-containing dehydrogenase
MSSRIAYRTCPLCEASCGLEIEIENESVRRIRGDRLHVLSAGYICPKGSTLKQLHEDPDRLRHPMMRDRQEWRQTTWDEAFAEVDRRLHALIERYGRNAVALYVGNPNVHHFENGLAIRPLAKALGTRNIYTASTVDQMPKHVACGHMFGHPATIPVPDLDRTQYLLMLGANPYESNGSLCTAPDWPGRLARIRARGGKVVVVDPRRTRTAINSDRWVPIRPGTDAALLMGLIHLLFEEDLVALGAMETEVAGMPELKEAAAPFGVEAVSRFTTVPPETIRTLATELAAAPRAAVYGRVGTHTVGFGTISAWAVDVLNVLTGNLDRPGGVMFPAAAHLPRRRRARPFATGRWQSRVRGLPEVLGELPVATLADEIETPGEDQIRALITVAGNPVVTTPDAERLDRALASLELMVAVDPYLNATTRHADVILPTPSALERSHYDIYFTALSVRNYADYSSAVFATEQPSEFEILVRLAAIAAGLGASADPAALAQAALATQVAEAVADPTSPIHGREPEEILGLLEGRPPAERALDLMLRTGHQGDGFGANPEGLSLQMLESHPHGLDLGSLEPRLSEVISTPSGKIELAPAPFIADLARLERAMTDLPGDLMLVGRRQVRTVNSWLNNVEVAIRGKDGCVLEVHPKDAERLGLRSPGSATVSSGTGTVELPVHITEDITEGVVSIPYGWGHDLPGMRLQVASSRPGVNLNRLTDATQVDPLSGNAVLNGIPVKVAPA